MKRILITCTDLMAIQFLLKHALYLESTGEYKICFACSNVGNRLDELYNVLKRNNIALYEVRAKRNPFKLGSYVYGIKDLKSLISNNNFDLIWTNEPVMSVITRIAFRKAKVKSKMLYMTHGYHFFKGSSFFSKILYLIEKHFSRYCDAIVTINKEDYLLTKRKFRCTKVYIIHGIGVDKSRFSLSKLPNEFKKEFGINDSDIVFLNAGELKKHKNQITILKAFKYLKNKNIKLLICGKGELKKKFERYIDRHNLKDQVFLLGYRKDFFSFFKISKYFIFPSIREGLGLASLEAMCFGLPVIGSNTRGIVDYVIDGKTGFLVEPKNSLDFARIINESATLNEAHYKSMSFQAKETAKKFLFENVRTEIERIIYEELND